MVIGNVPAGSGRCRNQRFFEAQGVGVIPIIIEVAAEFAITEPPVKFDRRPVIAADFKPVATFRVHLAGRFDSPSSAHGTLTVDGLCTPVTTSWSVTRGP